MSKDETLLFIGGPVDGRRQSVPVDQKIILIAARNPNIFTSKAPEIHIYKKAMLRFEEGDVMIAILESMSPLQAFLQMCEKYPPQFGQDLNAG